LPQQQPFPGGPGTIPERSQAPNMEPQRMVVTPNHISQAQQALSAKGFEPGVPGQLDGQTQESLADFQKKNNLPATGVLDEKTAAKLGVNLKN
jgi:peptidoglycan hydrolase-like protein with peptidoglycan-binding domain